ncbi:ABC-F family ATP-binding cassette domain-containing protein [Bradyrhizobium sp. U87765 SZCCT0131]|uniref:ABC-F family ATP-binding cassette domain-containing protein n=1 Tax=unclassified Bradyrhizobium TaxID=2631580 RepID=UPI001BA9F3F2|nr:MULTISPECIES: ABC-F family ATP-binding cassette domain-containing protein [unclassified Bradyrhizobium]MBR1220625.1 ABC-F family ATP-binding cassette domain-containing protein [Bradyrhizobium sp. U87765 SZCCT0131]MBR1262921.1 ABC-F family ATP-binding cassette domain-containing protein [Bradyrhizobium sp. U87765 SZCCT0134]MBR1307197.1 ABC-F family ATP-binding cassette domain-containing protein [Bradyrhizobium sp. U87765 SZCCT0110]MBR1322916.1 ABC-F family ATP-binding cassette domain-containin
MAPPLIQMKDIALTFGGTPLLRTAELSVSAGERVCLIGRNGSGKSTLLKIAAGLVEPDRGERFVQPGATIRYLPQEPDFSGVASTLAYVEAGLGPGDDVHPAHYLLEQLGLTGEEDPANLSGGEARRAALARVLAPSPDILLLDEPTNHLDLPTIEWLEGELSSRRCALVLISHDRRFLTNLSRSTVWLDRGQTRRIERGFGAFEEWRDEVLAEEERDQHKLDRKIVAEEHWLRYGVSGRRKRNVKRLANLHSLRDQRRDYRGAAGKAALTAATGETSGTLVIEARNVTKAWGERIVVNDFSIRMQRGDRLGIVGPNGAGKTTLINILTGALAPDSGSIRLGANIEMATLDQHRESLDPKTTLSEALTGGRGDHVMVGDKPKHVISYMKDFLFAQEQARTPLEVLSGGERGRLMLARALAKPSNLLVLDEPTNDLDLETLDVLEDLLGDYEGTVILISHDRDFLDRVVTSVIAPDGQGRWLEYAGGYSDMLTQRGEDLRRDAPKTAATRAAKEPTEPKASPAAAKRRLSFNEKHALETLPKTMAKLQADIAVHQKKLDDPALYARDRKAFDDSSAALAAAHAKLQEAEEKWLELEILREEIEQG